MRFVLGTLLSISLFFSCGSSDDASGNSNTPIGQNPTPDPTPQDPVVLPGTINYLALGDSYTIGQNVCETCRFPEQIKTRLAADYQVTTNLSIIATTGWTTTNLMSAINAQNPSSENDLVTLLIGVNNQYQHKPFSLYESEFPMLVTKAIALARGDKSNVIVVSIPDYAFTPYGQSSNPMTISAEIDQYNNFAKMYCQDNGIAFVNITDITRQGVQNPSLVASDGLHPSESAYAQFVELMMPKILTAIE